MDLGSARASLSSLNIRSGIAAITGIPGISDACRAPAVASPSPCEPQLLLFVGEAIRPDAALGALLARDGLRCLCLPGAEQAQRAAALARFDAVLIDGALVDGRAGRAIEALASTHQCPVVVLGEHADEVDEIVALEFGADLFLARPLAPRRLRAHLLALLRRRLPSASPAQSPTQSNLAPHGAGVAPPLQSAGWTLETAQQRLRRGTRAVRLTQGQTALLACLMSAGGAIVPAPALLAALPSPEASPNMPAPPPRSLRLHMHRLRQRLRDESVDGLRLEAVRGSGYALLPQGGG